MCCEGITGRNYILPKTKPLRRGEKQPDFLQHAHACSTRYAHKQDSLGNDINCTTIVIQPGTHVVSIMSIVWGISVVLSDVCSSHCTNCQHSWSRLLQQHPCRIACSYNNNNNDSQTKPRLRTVPSNSKNRTHPTRLVRAAARRGRP